MSYSNYSEIEIALSNRREFTGNSAYAVIRGDEYLVYSYSTLIAKSNRVANALVWVNPKKYSNTTSRLQNIVKRAWGVK